MPQGGQHLNKWGERAGLPSAHPGCVVRLSLNAFHNSLSGSAGAAESFLTVCVAPFVLLSDISAEVTNMTQVEVFYGSFQT